jgi:hypothetical protein
MRNVNPGPMLGVITLGISAALMWHLVTRGEEVLRAVLWPVVVLAEVAR